MQIRKVVAILVLLLPAVIAWSQTEISGSVFLTKPMSRLKEVYGSAPAYTISIVNNDKYKRKTKSFGVTFGYSKLFPIEDVYYYTVETVDGTEQGEAHYGDYISYQVMANLRSDYSLNKMLSLSYGLDVGLHLTTFEYRIEDPYTLDEDEEVTVKAALAPKFGLIFFVAPQVMLSTQVQYVFTFGRSNVMDASQRVLYSGLGIHYKFK